MDITSAQREMRQAYLGNFAGCSVAALLWAAAGALAVIRGPVVSMVFIALAGMFIYPLSQLLLKRVLGVPGCAPGNPLMALGWQVAMPAALLLPLVFATAQYRLGWFYPALLIAIGAHYLPFAFLYGMRLFLVLAVAMIAAGLAIGWWLPGEFALGAFVGAALMGLAGLVGRRVALAEQPA